MHGSEQRLGWAGLSTGCAACRAHMGPLPSVCRKFLSAHPEERGRLWEVEPPGTWGQRDSIWLKVQLQQSRLPDRELASESALSALFLSVTEVQID